MQLDILTFAARTLVDGGRLCMWMPSANESVPVAVEGHDTARVEPVELAIPSHPALELVSVCVQDFNKCMTIVLE